MLVPIHYSMDPDKTDEWVLKARSNYTREEDWNREMELDFTQVSGVRAYPNFRAQVHAAEKLEYNKMLPLCLCVDFNVGIMVWPIVQIVKGDPQVIDEIVMDPADVPSMTQKFREKYPQHPADLWIFGDASGHSRSSHDQQSDYEIMRVHLRGYPSPISWRVPEGVANPPVRDRLNAVNLMIKDPDGRSRFKVDPSCKHTLADFVEVILAPDGGIKKVSSSSDPYSKRTHASDAIGYMLAMEWPSVQDIYKVEEKTKYKPLRYGNLLGGNF